MWVEFSADEEDAFLLFLRSTSEISLLESFATTQSDLWVESFAKERRGHWSYAIWNRAFPWTPTYRQTTGGKDPGWWYADNTNIAPLLEYTRSNKDRGERGRLYWGELFSAPNGVAYDTQEFGIWVDTVWEWARKVRRRVV